MSSTRLALSLALLAAAAACSVPALAEEPATPTFKLLKTIPTASTGRWDFIAVQSDPHRLFIPRSTHVQVLDLDKGAVLADIPDTNGVHGVAFAPEQNLGFATDGKDNTLTAIDLKTLKATKTIKTAAGPDAILYDPASKHIFAMCHKAGDITVVDPANLGKEPATIHVGGTLEVAVTDGAGHLFVNVEDKSEVVEIDSVTNKVLAHWPLAPGEEPTGLAIDRKNHRLFAGCGNEKMIVLDAVSGKVVADVAIGKGVDGVAFDPDSGLAFSANGKDGTLSVVKETSPGKFAAVQTVKTLPGARTIAFDEKTRQLLLPCNGPDGQGGQMFVIAVVGAEEAKH